MKTIILTVEVKIDETNIVNKYPNFGINYDLRPDARPTVTALMDFAKSHIITEDCLREFGFATKITGAVFKF